MLYLADLHHDNLIKVGITSDFRITADGWRLFREVELRRQHLEPGLKVFLWQRLPWGWHDAEEKWEREVLSAHRDRSGRLQIFANQHRSQEVVEATRAEARDALYSVLSKTEVDPAAAADKISPDRVDWRFESFVRRQYYPRYSPADIASEWRSAIMRLAFLFHLRGEPIARWERETCGFDCSEIARLSRERRS